MFRPESSLETNIFLKDSQINTPYCNAIICGRGNMADISFVNQEKQRWKAVLKVYSFAQLKNNILYQEDQDTPESEFLINTWFTKQSNYSIIKYAGEAQLAFIFTSEKDPLQDLETLSSFDQLTYFREKAFATFLSNNLQLTIQELRSLPHVDEKRIQLFFNHTHALHQLIQHGATKEQLVKVDIKILEKCCGSSQQELEKILTCFNIPQLFSLKVAHLTYLINHLDNLKILIKYGLTSHHLQIANLLALEKCLQMKHLEDILQFVTILQILKIDPTPIPLDKILKENNCTQLSSSIDHFNGIFGEFSSEYNKNHLHVIPRNKQTNEQIFFHLEFIKPDETVLTEISKMVEKNDPAISILVHDWYVIENINVTDVKKMIMYSPELNLVMYETYTLSFPEEKLKNDLLMLSIAPYYEEKEFAALLNKKGCPIETFKYLPGMSLKKMEVLCHNQDAMIDLMLYGIKIDDFAMIDENRLIYMLTHYDKAKYALALVNARECLGLLPPLANYSSKLFPSPTSNQSDVVDVPSNNYSYCSII